MPEIPENTIWVVTDDTPKITIPDGTRSGIDRGNDWGDETETNGTKGVGDAVKVSVEKLEQEMSHFLQVVRLFLDITQYFIIKGVTMGKIKSTFWEFLKGVFGSRELSSVSSNVVEPPQKTVQSSDLKKSEPTQKPVQSSHLKNSEDEKFTQFLENLKDEGLGQFIRNNFDGARIIFDRILTLNPDNSEILLLKANVLYSLGLYEEVIAICNHTLEIEPNVVKVNYYPFVFPLVWKIRASSLYHLKRYDEAIADYTCAIEIEPDDYELWLWRGNTLDKLNRDEEAITNFKHALELEKNDNLVWISQASCLNNLKRYEEGIDSCNHAIALKPDDDQAWYIRGAILNNLNRYSEALSNFDRALEINPDFADALYKRSFSLGSLGQYKEAEESQNRAFEIAPKNYFTSRIEWL